MLAHTHSFKTYGHSLIISVYLTGVVASLLLTVLYYILYVIRFQGCRTILYLKLVTLYEPLNLLINFVLGHFLCNSAV